MGFESGGVLLRLACLRRKGETDKKRKGTTTNLRSKLPTNRTSTTRKTREFWVGQKRGDKKEKGEKV